MSKLTGKVAVVTGASKRIGAAIAKSLAAEGASVVVNYGSSSQGQMRSSLPSMQPVAKQLLLVEMSPKALMCRALLMQPY